uniref:Ral GTPase-activating protein subunit alpha/beta N-terminal domain-containing protein n=1 Tax=Acrobeloides nanus TaxID=290746 RepID=A0A914DRJ0_9BILA
MEETQNIPNNKPSFKQLSRQVRKASMFARKPKSTDVQNSLQRFCDVHRDASSRAKHFKYLLEQLCVEEKRQLVDDYSFETFHLVDSLLLQVEISIDSQSVIEAESALWTLEQVLCLAPELVGKGWQRHAIESILKRALLPQNLLAVRKIGIRLFLLWYQSLAAYNNTTSELDVVFQSLLPYFPLTDGRSTDRIIQEYCEYISVPMNGAFHSGGPGPSKASPIIINSQQNGQQVGTREKAQTLQIYLDKFLDYCNRETTKIEWDDENKRLDCAKFLLDRIIVLYVYQVFPDMETNGVDVFGGWEGNEEPGEQLDTADPVVIARYWLIRWMTNIASSALVENPAPGLLIFRKALFSSQKAINTSLTMMREAMQLPLACANVIHKVLFLIRNWLLQKEIPPFVESGVVSLETSSLLLIHLYTTFFKSPYLSSSGERLQSAISLTHTILQISRDLANPAAQALPRALPKTVWTELIKRITQAVARCCSRSDAFGCSTAGGFTQTLLSICVFIRAIREVDVDERMWDEIWLVFRHGIWMTMVEQWSKVVDNVTRALILNLFAIDISSGQAIEDGSNHTSEQGVGRRTIARSDKSSESGSVNGYPTSEADDDAIADNDSNTDISAVVQ